MSLDRTPMYLDNRCGSGVTEILEASTGKILFRNGGFEETEKTDPVMLSWQHATTPRSESTVCMWKATWIRSCQDPMILN